MGKLSTHVLDTMHGRPAGQMRVMLYRISDTEQQLLTDTQTNDDGRCDGPLLQGDALQQGVYELIFYAGDYFATMGFQTTGPRFVDQVALRFGVANPDQNYHVPLLVTPWAWSTYRGS